MIRKFAGCPFHAALEKYQPKKAAVPETIEQIEAQAALLG